MIVMEALFGALIGICILMAAAVPAILMQVSTRAGRIAFGILLIIGFLVGASIPAVPYF